MEWLKKLIEKYTADGQTDVEAVMNAVNTEFPKHAVTKAAYKEQGEKLKNATDTLEKLQAEHAGNEALQAELLDYKNKVEALEIEAKQVALKQSVKDALLKSGATDVDYLLYKLGDVEVGDDGQVVDLDHKIKDLQSNLPNFFATEPEKPSQFSGYQSLGGADLQRGNAPQPQDLSAVLANSDINLTQFIEQQTKGD